MRPGTRSHRRQRTRSAVPVGRRFAFVAEEEHGRAALGRWPERVTVERADVLVRVWIGTHHRGRGVDHDEIRLVLARHLAQPVIPVGIAK